MAEGSDLAQGVDLLDTYRHLGRRISARHLGDVKNRHGKWQYIRQKSTQICNAFRHNYRTTLYHLANVHRALSDEYG